MHADIHVDDYNVSDPDVAKVLITTGSKGEYLHKKCNWLFQHNINYLLWG